MWCSKLKLLSNKNLRFFATGLMWSTRKPADGRICFDICCDLMTKLLDIQSLTCKDSHLVHSYIPGFAHCPVFWSILNSWRRPSTTPRNISICLSCCVSINKVLFSHFYLQWTGQSSQTSKVLLVFYRSRLKTKGHCAFKIEAPKLWNCLPLDFRSVDNYYCK